MKKLFYGDNLDVLQNHIADDSIDLIYLDPPFNSNADYNVIFRDHKDQKSTAQIVAFEDTWHWGMDDDAAKNGLYKYGNSGIQKIQILTVEDLFNGKQPDLPKGSTNVSYE